jgi:phosphate starvation-inducible protein PhoH and related proteins
MARKSTKELDLEAREEARVGANKKKFTEKDLVNFYPKTQAQRDLISQWNEDKSMLIVGSAGTGKTVCALWMALRDVLEQDSDYEKLIIIRSIVPSREVGYLPGTLESKLEVYETPYRALCDELFPYANTYNNLKKNGYLEFESTSFLRGTTFNNAIVIVEEAQNMSWQELHTCMTRIGMYSKIIFIGDDKQVDLQKKNDPSGFPAFVKVLDRMKSIEKVTFAANDVVRSGLVKEYLLTLEDTNG